MDEQDYKTIKYSNCKAHNDKDYNVSRILFVDNEGDSKYKFKEEITFLNNMISAEKRAVCIGYNPAKAEEDIDRSNKRLINLLWDYYNGYDLYNLYPEVTDNKNQVNLEDSENVEFLDKLIEKIAKDKRDIILFFGRTTVIPKAFEEFLSKRPISNNIKITAHNGEFTHPGSNSQINLMDFNVDFLKTDTVIRVIKPK
ncbi:DUF1643 domain-containing protein [Acholeplasma equifetale]|uniref:DUF1643 domain-containing protein n=1 Tax=Acholeplasma equifetale TaxID=264634 RepID=UPI00138ADFDE|nr:DUF1643 domain-containing protein [Acholeplasma equifetale]